MDYNEIISWLLNSDPAIRWQVMKDIQGDEESVYNKERQKLVREGWCAKLLGKQAKTGLWNESLYNGKAIKTKWTSFSFPPYWFYDVLTVLDYFKNYEKNRDRRIQTGIDLVIKKRNKEGTWDLGSKHAGKTFFDMENPGEPSRWITLRALGVLKWWEQ